MNDRNGVEAEGNDVLTLIQDLSVDPSSSIHETSAGHLGHVWEKRRKRRWGNKPRTAFSPGALPIGTPMPLRISGRVKCASARLHVTAMAGKPSAAREREPHFCRKNAVLTFGLSGIDLPSSSNRIPMLPLETLLPAFTTI